MAHFTILRKGGRGGTASKGVDLDSAAFIAALADLEQAGASVAAEVTPAIAEVLVSAIQEVFEKEGAVAGQPKWPELAPSTKKKRAKRQPSGVFTILQDTGLMAGSITPYSEALVAEAFTNVPYAGFHVSQRARRKIPLRDFTAIDFDAAQAEATDMILSQLLDTAAE